MVDVSDSVTRNPGALTTALKRSAAAIKVNLDLSAEKFADWSSSITVFARGAARLHSSVPLQQVSALLGNINARSMRTDASAGAEALKIATDTISESGQPGAVLLLTDGNWTGATAEKSVQRLVQDGVPIHVLPVSSPQPGIGIVAADLPTAVELGRDTTLRMVLLRGSEKAQTFDLAWQRNGEIPRRAAQGYTMNHLWRPARIPVRFSERGVQFVDVELATKIGVAQKRRLFTLVLAAPRVLVLGQARWADGLSADNYQLERRSVSEPFDPHAYDVVVIDSVQAQSLADGMLEALAHATRVDGVGLLLVNGRHVGDREAPTRIMTYEKTALAPLLPVASEARMVLQEPPPRDIIIVIDTSSSMIGWNLSTAKAVAAEIISNLRSVDTARIVAFTTSYREVLGATRMDGEGQAIARKTLARLRASGGTDPTGALQFAGQFTSNYCGLFFLSDGEFNPSQHKPECMSTVFQVNESGRSAKPQLRHLGQVEVVNRNSWPRRLVLKFFEPEPRHETYRDGRFHPQHVLGDPSLTPRLAVEGVAISYPRPEAELVSVHPEWPADPVVAFRNAETGVVGVFMSELPDAWGRHPAGRKAIDAYLNRLISWNDTERFDLRFQQIGESIEVTVTVVGDGDRAVNVERLTASVTFSDGTTQPLRLDNTDGTPGVFQGRFPLPARGNKGAMATRANLYITEGGEGAVARAQRIPMTLPTAGNAVFAADIAEAWTHGINETMLRALADMTGGRFPVGDRLEIGRVSARPVDRPLFPWLLALAAACIVATIALGGGRL